MPKIVLSDKREWRSETRILQDSGHPPIESRLGRFSRIGDGSMLLALDGPSRLETVSRSQYPPAVKHTASAKRSAPA
jgi:hypothetical protein